jgi:predicted GNAT family acetyltransferase
VGFSSLIRVETTGWIPYVGIDPKFQGHGLGKKFLHKTLEMARELQLKTIELCSSQTGVPFYQSLNFKVDYPVRSYDIVEAKRSSQQDLRVDTTIPDWILKMDREVVGIDRQKLFHIHRYDQVPIINEPSHCYGFLYKTRIGPIIADSLPLAQEIILKVIELGATSLILVEDTVQKKQVTEVVDLKLQPLMDTTKMIYGIPLQQDLVRLYGFRSEAYG